MNRLGITDDLLSKICRYYKKGRLLENNFWGDNLRWKIGDKKDFYNYIKSFFYDPINHKWLIKKGVNYIREKKLTPNEFTDFLRDFHSFCTKSGDGPTSMRQYLKFVENLENNTKLHTDRFSSRQLRLNLKPKTDFNEFLLDFYSFAKHIDARDTMLIDLLFNAIETNYSKSTLTRIYYDNKPKTDKK